MQDLKIDIQIRDLNKGELPPKEGYYAVFTPGPSPFDMTDIRVMWWDAEEQAWRTDKYSRVLFQPTEHIDRYWTDNFLSGVIKG